MSQPIFSPDGFTAVAALCEINVIDRHDQPVTDLARKRAQWAAVWLQDSGFVNWTWRRMLEKTALVYRVIRTRS